MPATFPRWVAVGRPLAHRWEIRLGSRTRACAPWWRNWAVRERSTVVLPPPLEVQTRTCGASASRSTAMACPLALMPMRAVPSGSASICSRRSGA
ncbi:hypothetical protein CG724_16930 [Streptomyces sp. CB02120-2]|nr:hypothetical protein CG724_16930 [Streptomyces sp. CB02120-2]